MAQMSFEQSMKILESAGIELERIDEARGAFSLRKFERVLNAAMREVDHSTISALSITSPLSEKTEDLTTATSSRTLGAV